MGPNGNENGNGNGDGSNAVRCGRWLLVVLMSCNFRTASSSLPVLLAQSNLLIGSDSHRPLKMNSFLVLVLIASLTLLQVNAFLPSSVLKASTILKSLGTRLQFKNFDEMLEQLEVPVLVDFYGESTDR